LRKNEVGRWVANDILKQGNKYRSYAELPVKYEDYSKADPFGNKAYIKIPDKLPDDLIEN
jgi:hypothetical protein